MDQEKIRVIVRWTVLIPIIGFLLYSVVFVTCNPITPKYQDCGAVTMKSNDEVAMKYGTRTELYLLVSFDKSGSRAMNVSPTTYFNTRVGDRLCFMLPEPTSVFYFIKLLVGFSTLTILGALCYIYLLYMLFFVTYSIYDKMKLFLTILTTLLLASCGSSSDEVVISQEDYKKLIGDTIKPEYPKTVEVLYTNNTWGVMREFTICLATDGHEYQRHYESDISDQWVHYGGCKKCQKERDELNRKLDLILQSIKTTKNK